MSYGLRFCRGKVCKRAILRFYPLFLSPKTLLLQGTGVEPSFWKDNRPLTSSKNPHFQKEAKCTAFLAKMTFICMRMKKHFHIKSWGLNVVLMQRPGGSRKWLITNYSGAPPYGHLGNTVTSSLQPLFFGPEKRQYISLQKKTVNPGRSLKSQTVESLIISPR